MTKFINANPVVVTNVQFRKALMYAMNRQEMVDTIMGGFSEIAHSLLLPTDPEAKQVEPSMVKYDYDPARATQMIEGLGFTRGTDGFFRDAAGQKVLVWEGSANRDGSAFAQPA